MTAYVLALLMILMLSFAYRLRFNLLDSCVFLNCLLTVIGIFILQVGFIIPVLRARMCVRTCVCVCVCVCARARVCVCVCVNG